MLPKIDVPVYELKLPILKKSIKYRPFLVKEEKILLMAMEAGDEKTVIDAVKQIINNCCLDDIDVNSLALVDMEYLFLNLRARSIGEVVELQYKCNNTVQDENGQDKICANVVPIEVNLLDIKPQIEKDHTNKIEFSPNMGMMMKYPNMKMIEVVEGESEVEKMMNLILDSVDLIYDKDTIYYSKDIDRNELLEFIESLTKEQFEKVQKFFTTLPKIKKDLDFKCKKCGHNEKVTIERNQNFFV